MSAPSYDVRRGRPGVGSPSQPGLRQPALTKRRAVDYCRVATALCRTGSAGYASRAVSAGA